jgi:hypothetical protein
MSGGPVPSFRVGAFALLVAVVGCVHTNSTILSTEARPALDPSAVALYTSADKVPGKYDEVALIDSKGDDMWVSEHKMLESIRKEAAKVGANGVILQAESEPGTAASVAHALIGTRADRHGKALAIFVYPATTATAGGSQP